MMRWLLKMTALLLILGVFLLGLIALGRTAWQQLQEHPRYTIHFADIDCPPPPHRQRAEFLDEVQYLSNLPDHLQLLEEDLSKRLADAFARHPWVEKVERVVLLPTRQVQVRLRYRRPVLAVPLAGQLRVVDAQGVLLPRDTPATRLPVFSGPVPPPRNRAGLPWGNAAIEAAAQKAGRSNR
jgi:hypothetical protein